MLKKNLLLLLAYFLLSNGHAQYANSKVANVNTPGDEKSQRINNNKREVTAPTPPMGWNSWNNYGCDIKEAEFRSQVDYVASKLRKVGYQYMTIDISWYSPSVSADPRSPFHHPTYSPASFTKAKPARPGFVPQISEPRSRIRWVIGPTLTESCAWTPTTASSRATTTESKPRRLNICISLEKIKNGCAISQPYMHG